MSALYEIISVATDIVEMSITQFAAQPKVCEAFVQRIQNIRKAWDEHPDWHGRSWFVQVLLAVTSLSRVVEWWEVENNSLGTTRTRRALDFCYQSRRRATSHPNPYSPAAWMASSLTIATKI